MDLVIEAIDQQLALLWEARGILAGEPASDSRKPARKPAKRLRGAKPAPAPKPPASARKKPSPAQRALAFEHPPVAAVDPVPAVPGQAATLSKREDPVAAEPVVRKVARKPRTPRTAPAAVIPAPPVWKALASTIPSGPVVVMAASVAREREERSAKTAPVQSITAPKLKSGLDALIEEAAARSGMKTDGLNRLEAS